MPYSQEKGVSGSLWRERHFKGVVPEEGPTGGWRVLLEKIGSCFRGVFRKKEGGG